MIVRRFGATVGAVVADFHATAFNEIAFARRPSFSLPREEFEAGWQRTGELLLGAESEGHVKLEAEEALLDLLAHRLAQAERDLPPDELLLIESQPGHDYPRTHEQTETLVENGRNRLHFHYHIDPPLKLGVYR
ncbi:MAG TPA: hypothetical protein VF832_13185, partial [Longimicrobiales bacterium]